MYLELAAVAFGLVLTSNRLQPPPANFDFVLATRLAAAEQGIYLYIAMIRSWLLSALTGSTALTAPGHLEIDHSRRLVDDSHDGLTRGSSTALSACCGVVRVQRMHMQKTTES